MIRPLGLILLLHGLLLSLSDAAEPGDFAAQIRQHFEKWDTDRDACLSGHEIERAVADPMVKGDEAATAAALRRGIRSDHTLTPVSLEQIIHGIQEPKKWKPDFDAMFATAQERIRTARRELFVSDLPRAEAISQGKLGDCFLLATLGRVAACDPERLKRMFNPLPGEKVEVTLGTGRKLVIDMPTDAEICIGARNDHDGMWAIAFEKAIGTIFLERQKTPRHVTPLSIIGVGGTPNVPLSLLTGHAVQRTGCEDFQRGHRDGEAREQRLAEVRERLAESVRKGRLIVGGTAPLGGRQTVVPGLYYNHSYGVLAYDEKADTVTFWNPFGNRYTPKGPPGLQSGYVTEHGRFTMPLAEAVLWFGSFSIETDEPAIRAAD